MGCQCSTDLVKGGVSVAEGVVNGSVAYNFRNSLTLTKSPLKRHKTEKQDSDMKEKHQIITSVA